MACGTSVARIIVGMNVKEILAQLKSLGDNARRKHNTKAGTPDNQFGVKLGDIRAMAKKIKTDHELALNLWDTGNVEAQLLANPEKEARREKLVTSAKRG
jgi:3-methyladenine DNA glycosylase AlkD